MSGSRPDTWMPLYWGDYLRDTAHLSASEHGAYLLLIGHYWTSGQPLQDDDARLARIARMSPREWKAARVALSEFFNIDNGLWSHKRIDRELAKAVAKTEAKAEAGRRGAEKRWRSDGKTNGTAMAEPSGSHRQTDAPSQPHPQEDTPLLSVSSNPPSSANATEGGSASAPSDRPPSARADPLAQMADEYNQVAKRYGLPRCAKMNGSRRKSARARLKEIGGMDAWKAAMAKVAASPFLKGENDRNWRCDFDFLLQPSSLLRVIEGKYDPPGATSPAPDDGLTPAQRLKRYKETRK